LRQHGALRDNGQRTEAELGIPESTLTQQVFDILAPVLDQWLLLPERLTVHQERL